jgi:hypothetical protein
VVSRVVLPVDAQLRPHQRVWLGIEILVLYVLVRWWMWRLGLTGTVARLRALPGAPGHPPERQEALRFGWRYAAAVIRFLRGVPTDTRCLMRSLVLVGLLARRGAHGELVIGVRTGEEFGAHAWVEYDGEPLLEPGESGSGRLLEL